MKINILISLVLLVTACGQDIKTDKKAENQQESSIKYDFVTYEKKSAQDTSSVPPAIININYPVINSASSNAVKDSINQFIQKKLKRLFEIEKNGNNLEELTTLFFEAFSKAKKNSLDGSPEWVIEQQFNVNFENNSLLVINHSDYSFTGGEQPRANTFFYNFNLKNGSLLKLDNLLNDKNNVALLSIAEQKFRQIKMMEDGATLKSEGYIFPQNKFYLSTNFGIGNYGITFMYNNNEIAPYELGATELLITYAELKGFLKNELIQMLKE